MFDEGAAVFMLLGAFVGALIMGILTIKRFDKYELQIKNLKLENKHLKIRGRKPMKPMKRVKPKPRR